MQAMYSLHLRQIRRSACPAVRLASQAGSEVWQPYFVPVLLHTALGPRWKGLSIVRRLHIDAHRTYELLTLAISPQLLPASRIVFNLCSSVAVQGVLVRPFFLAPSSATVANGADVVCAGSVAAVLLPSPGPDGLAGDLFGLDSGSGEARRFLGLGGDGGTVDKIEAAEVA